MTHQPPVIEVTVAAPVDVVWSALRERDQLRRWHGWIMDGLDEEIDFIYHQHVQADDDRHVLQLVGHAPGDYSTGDRFELSEVDGGTVVRIVRGPRPPADHEWAGYYDDVTEGWALFVQQLRFALERQRGRDRRTVFVSATRLGDGSLAEAVGTDSGSPLGFVGTQFFVDGVRAGAEVPELGPGLVITGAGAGKELLVLTAYGLDDDAFASITERVRDFWSQRHPDADPPSV